jgi:hypothetical protein
MRSPPGKTIILFEFIFDPPIPAAISRPDPGQHRLKIKANFSWKVMVPIV